MSRCNHPRPASERRHTHVSESILVRRPVAPCRGGSPHDARFRPGATPRRRLPRRRLPRRRLPRRRLPQRRLPQRRHQPRWLQPRWLQPRGLPPRRRPLVVSALLRQLRGMAILLRLLPLFLRLLSLLLRRRSVLQFRPGVGFDVRSGLFQLLLPVVLLLSSLPGAG